MTVNSRKLVSLKEGGIHRGRDKDKHRLTERLIRDRETVREARRDRDLDRETSSWEKSQVYPTFQDFLLTNDEKKSKKDTTNHIPLTHKAVNATAFNEMAR